MELEALKSQISDELGSTKLQLSEKTLNAVLQDALAEIGDDDSKVTNEFIARKVNLAKTIDGQINFDVSTRIKDWKSKNTPQEEPKVVEKTSTDEEPAWFKAYREKSEQEIAELKRAKAESEAKATKDNILRQVKEGLKEKFSKAGIEENAYIMKQTLRDADITPNIEDVNSLIKDIEKKYYSNLKEAGLNTDMPRNNAYGGGSKGKSAVDSYFSKKKAKEGWGK